MPKELCHRKPFPARERKNAPVSRKMLREDLLRIGENGKFRKIHEKGLTFGASRFYIYLIRDRLFALDPSGRGWVRADGDGKFPADGGSMKRATEVCRWVDYLKGATSFLRACGSPSDFKRIRKRPFRP